MAAASRKAGTIRLDIGDPDFQTPDHVVAAAHRAAREGHTHYLPSAGHPELREALAEKVNKRNGYAVDPSGIVITQGASQGIHAALLALTQPGEAVLLPDPAWPNYLMMCGLQRIRPITYPMRAVDGFVPDPNELESLITSETRVLLLNSPANPTGAVIGARRMSELIEFAIRHDLWVISDECYDEVVFDDSFVSPATLDSKRVITAYSFSKTYAMTGWRVGYLAVPEPVAEPLGKVQESLLACVAEPVQLAALAALTGPQDEVTTMRETYRRRRDLVLSALRRSGNETPAPAGAFYVWIDVSAGGLPDREFAMRLIDRYAVSVAPGTAFGAAGSGFVRISLTAADQDLAEGTGRLLSFLAS